VPLSPPCENHEFPHSLIRKPRYPRLVGGPLCFLLGNFAGRPTPRQNENSAKTARLAVDFQCVPGCHCTPVTQFASPGFHSTAFDNAVRRVHVNSSIAGPGCSSMVDASCSICASAAPARGPPQNGLTGSNLGLVARVHPWVQGSAIPAGWPGPVSRFALEVSENQGAPQIPSLEVWHP